ncbi:isoprenylcysteine carboxylmethyltransferase family protein [Pendulispora brunnea]|uniref:Isoprenylcysteine carboxylmethyltransferase family protein n=1 Tax=Pendulispora brunnea TaxID=2905690 RepID=A0ABZ2KCR8_9BACT
MNRLHRFSPLLVFCSALLALAILGPIKCQQLPPDIAPFATILFLGYGAWLLLEARITWGEGRKAVAQRDNGTLEVYAVGRLLTLLTTLACPTRRPAAPIVLLGCLIFVGGIALRLFAIRHLGRAYSHRVRTPEPNLLVTHGVYRTLRHPAYSGMLLAHAGLVTAVPNWAAIFVLFLVFVPAVIWRIRTEETLLFESLPGYRDYAVKRKRIIPAIW